MHQHTFFSNDLPIEACQSMRNWSLGWNWGLACNCIIILTFFPLHDLPAYGLTDRLYRMADQGLAEHTFNKLIVLFILHVDFLTGFSTTARGNNFNDVSGREGRHTLFIFNKEGKNLFQFICLFVVSLFVLMHASETIVSTRRFYCRQVRAVSFNPFFFAAVWLAG